MKKERAEIVKSGTWLYGGSISYEVWIVRQNFEYHYEEEFDESEHLNEDGELFAVVYARDGGVVGQGGAESLTLNEAITIAEHAIPQGIKWDDHRLQPLFGGRQYRLEENPVDDT
jgi:hypothetical protein